MWTLRYYSTGSLDWQVACQSDDPRYVVRKFDEKVLAKRLVPAAELLLDDKVVMRMGLPRPALMKLAVLGARVKHRCATETEKERFNKTRARAVKEIEKKRVFFLDALVV